MADDGAELRETAEQMLAHVEMSPAGEGMVGIHMIYLGCREAGFTETQSLWIASYCAVAGAQPPPPPSE